MSAIVLVARTRRVLALQSPGPLGAAADARLRALRAPADRDDFVAARLLAARALRELGARAVAPGELRQRCDVCGGEHGRPLPVAGLQVSWSHSRGWVAAAASRSRLGVDIEADAAGPEARSVQAPGVLEPALTPAERAFVRAAPDPARLFRLAWTAKEAGVKAGVARLDTFGELSALAGTETLLPALGGLALSTRQVSGATASAATPGPARWSALGDDGALIRLDAAGSTG